MYSRAFVESVYTERQRMIALSKRKSEENTVDSITFDKEISVENLSFTYEEGVDNVINDASFKIERIHRCIYRSIRCGKDNHG